MPPTKQRKIAASILAMLDPQKQRRSRRYVVIHLILSFMVLIWANRSESPLAVMPQTFASVMLGYLVFYWQSVRIYPHIAKYFDVAALERDARGVPPPVPAQAASDAQQNP